MLGTPVLAVVPHVEGAPEQGSTVVSQADPESAAAEAYRSARPVLLHRAGEHDVKTILVTGPGQGEGKSTTTANLGVVLARSGHRVVMVSCDLRKPALHRLFGLAREPGLSDVLQHRIALRDALVRTGVPNLVLLPTGAPPANPSELLGSGAMAAVIASCAPTPTSCSWTALRRWWWPTPSRSRPWSTASSRWWTVPRPRRRTSCTCAGSSIRSAAACWAASSTTWTQGRLALRLVLQRCVQPRGARVAGRPPQGGRQGRCRQGPGFVPAEGPPKWMWLWARRRSQGSKGEAPTGTGRSPVEREPVPEAVVEPFQRPDHDGAEREPVPLLRSRRPTPRDVALSRAASGRRGQGLCGTNRRPRAILGVV